MRIESIGGERKKRRRRRRRYEITVDGNVEIAGEEWVRWSHIFELFKGQKILETEMRSALRPRHKQEIIKLMTIQIKRSAKNKTPLMSTPGTDDSDSSVHKSQNRIRR